MEDVRAWIAHLNQELWLLERTKHNIYLWNHLVRIRSHMNHIVVGFEYVPRVGEPAVDLHKTLAFRYNGGPVGALASYECTVPDVRLHAILPGSAEAGTMPYFSDKMRCEIVVLMREIQAIHDQLYDLEQILRDADAYAPGGEGHRYLVRKYAQEGMTRYRLRPP
jgi:hypothetical protein